MDINVEINMEISMDINMDINLRINDNNRAQSETEKSFPLADP